MRDRIRQTNNVAATALRGERKDLIGTNVRREQHDV
jgi:hypothetical protein